MSITEAPADPAGSAISPAISKAVEGINKGSLSYTALLDLIAGRRDEKVRVPEKLPVPAAITAEQTAALERLPVVFGKVVPIERRTLGELEVAALLLERQTLDTIESLAKDRKNDIRTTLFNHWDVQYEATHTAEECNATPRDKDGHYVVDAEERVTGEKIKFTREVREGSVVMDPADLEALAKDESVPEFTHSDYLGMTEQVRVVREHKVMEVLKKKPGLVSVLARVTTRGSKTASFWQRKA